MPKFSDERLKYPASKPAFPGLFKALAGDGARWADAELALARAEAGILLRRYVAGFALASLAFAASIAALVILAQACAAALAPYVDGQVSANLVVCLVLIGLVMLFSLAARHFLTRKAPPLGLIFRWLSGIGTLERNSK